MKFSRYLLLVLPAVACLVQQGCKKEQTELDYLNGVLSLRMDPFVSPGYTKTFMIDTLMTVSRPDGGTVGYYFYNQDSGQRDTLVTADGRIKDHYYTLTVPETRIGTVTLWLYAFVPSDANYYGSSASASTVVVRSGLDGNGTISGFDTSAGSKFTDARDGREYYRIEAGGNTWMRENLAWKGAGSPYIGCASMTDIFGHYYTWDEAMQACPEGWRLPADADWTALSDGAAPGADIPGLAGRLMGNLSFNDTRLWPYWREVNITDVLQLSVMPTGYAVVGEGRYNFTGVSEYAVFWTADESGDQAVIRYIYQDKDILYRGQMLKGEFAATVRCVKE
ncbi:MAG: hypothetical protein GXY24_06830 [Bacteroidales bacterium]|nr:hypothetical protein [Bacteroidales bacterium]